MVDVIASAVGDTPTLLVLDNLEQVIDVGPDLALLLERTPALRILASSREALRIGGEQELPVPVLDGELSVELFIERARRVRPDFDPSASERAELRDLVARLDHLPLAIELAAARARRMSVATLCEQVPGSLVDLDSGRRDAGDRQRTLRGAVAWSYELLDEAERQTFDRLAVFSGGAELELMGEIVDPGRPGLAVLDDVESLADKSLLIIGEGPAGEPRTRMLETIHAYATERFEMDPQQAAVRERHARRYLRFCEAIEPELTGEDSVDALARMEADHDNVRAAFDWALEHDPALGLRLGGAIWRFWQQRAHMEEGQRRLEALFAAADAGTDRYALGRGSTALGGACYWQGDYEQARRRYEDAVGYYRECGDAKALAGALYDLAYPIAILGQREDAFRLNDESQALFEELGDEAGVSLVKEGKAVLSAMTGDFETARELQQEVIAHRRAVGGLFGISDNLGLMLMIEAKLGNFTEARALLEEVRDVQRRLHDRSGLAGALEVRALVASGEGDFETAAICIGAVQGMRDRSTNMLVPSEMLGFFEPSKEPLERLHADRYEALFELGRSMDPEEVFLSDGLAADLA
jgi:predicted ATPase